MTESPIFYTRCINNTTLSNCWRCWHNHEEHSKNSADVDKAAQRCTTRFAVLTAGWIPSAPQILPQTTRQFVARKGWLQNDKTWALSTAERRGWRYFTQRCHALLHDLAAALLNAVDRCTRHDVTVNNQCVHKILF